MKKEPPQHSPTSGTQKANILCYVAGHSGGHIIPCLTLAQHEIKKGNSILFFTSDKQLDHKIVQQNDVPLTHISLAINQQQRSWYRLPILALSVIWAAIKSWWYLLLHMPDRIITTGSIVAIPVCIAGWLLGIPIELFELNARAGKTILFLSHCASTVRHCFAITHTQFSRNTCIQTNYPIRFASEECPYIQLPGFEKNRITIFVQGGSQGSQGINAIMQKLLTQNSELCSQIQVIHQAGPHTNTVKNMYDALHVPAHVFAYDHNLAPYYQMADLAICRSGAGALFEALHFKKQCITIPLIIPSNDNQLHNARAMATEYSHLFHIAHSSSELIIAIQKTIPIYKKKIVTSSIT